MKRLILSIAGTVLGICTLASPAYAYDWFVDAKIALIEPDYMPGWVSFTVNAAGGSCAAGAFLTYNAQGSTAADKQANVSAVLAALLTAQARNGTIRIYGNNAGCTISNVWVYS